MCIIYNMYSYIMWTWMLYSYVHCITRYTPVSYEYNIYNVYVMCDMFVIYNV